MAETKHTPGPWLVTSHQRASLAEASTEVHSQSGRTICDMGDYPNAEDETNARLIAAAPETARQRDELVEACKKSLVHLRLHLRSCELGSPDGNTVRSDIDYICAAIANAT